MTVITILEGTGISRICLTYDLLLQVGVSVNDPVFGGQPPPNHSQQFGLIELWQLDPTNVLTMLG